MAIRLNCSNKFLGMKFQKVYCGTERHPDEKYEMIMIILKKPRPAHLGGDDAIVGVTLRDVGLSSRRGFFMPDVDRPAVHPDLLPHTLTERHGYIKSYK